MVMKVAPDGLAIQETIFSTDEQVGQALKSFLSMYDVSVSHAVGTSTGFLIFLRKALDVCNLSLLTDESG